jgi:hypothetical protein
VAQLIVTVQAPGRRVTVGVPGDLPMEELLPLLLPTFSVDVEPAGWTVVPRGGTPLFARETLDGAGVLQGSILDLRPPSQPPTSYLLRPLSSEPPRRAPAIDPATAFDESLPLFDRLFLLVARELRRFRRHDQTAVARLVALGAVVLGASIVVAIGEQAAPGILASAALTPAAAGTVGRLPPPIHGSFGRPMHLSGLQLTVTNVSAAAAPPPGLRARSGERLVAVDVRYHNVGSGPVIVSPYDWALTGPSGSSYGAVQAAAADSLPQRQLAPGKTQEGLVWFEVPATIRSGLVLNFSAELGYETATVRVS